MKTMTGIMSVNGVEPLNLSIRDGSVKITDKHKSQVILCGNVQTVVMKTKTTMMICVNGADTF